MALVRLARMAMASRFELLLEGEDEVWLRAAGEAALSEIQRLDAQLSIYQPTSEMSRINARAGYEAVPVEPRLFALLQAAKRIYDISGGAFDVTVAPLMKAWGFFRGEGSMPSPEVLAAAREITGMHLVHLDESTRTVRFARPGVSIDLGAIGKGFAVDEAIAVLRESGVRNAFLHGGTSTSFGMGHSPDGEAWYVSIDPPVFGDPGSSEPSEPVAIAELRDASLSVSAIWGKAFEHEGEVCGHILDPRKGRPVEGAALTAVVSASATEADALSTALLVQGRQSKDLLALMENGHKALLLFSSSANGIPDAIEAGLSFVPSARRRLIDPE